MSLCLLIQEELFTHLNNLRTKLQTNNAEQNLCFKFYPFIIIFKQEFIYTGDFSKVTQLFAANNSSKINWCKVLVFINDEEDIIDDIYINAKVVIKAKVAKIKGSITCNTAQITSVICPKINANVFIIDSIILISMNFAGKIIKGINYLYINDVIYFNNDSEQIKFDSIVYNVFPDLFAYELKYNYISVIKQKYLQLFPTIKIECEINNRFLLNNPTDVALILIFACALRSVQA